MQALLSKLWQNPFVEKIAFLGLLSLLLCGLQVRDWPFYSVVLAAMTFFPQLRWQILPIASIAGWLWMNHLGWHNVRQTYLALGFQGIDTDSLLYRIPIVSLFLAISLLFLKLSTFFSQNRHRSVLLFATFYLVLLAVANQMRTYSILAVMIWGLVPVLLKIFWWLSLDLVTSEAKSDTSFKGILTRVFYFQPAWSLGSWVPIPGALSHLRRVEVFSEEDLRALRSSAVRLLLFVFVTKALWDALGFFLIGKNFGLLGKYPQIPFEYHRNWGPYFDGIIQMKLVTDPESRPSAMIRWAFFYYKMFGWLVDHAFVHGGIVVALVRGSGFRAFRNVYRPFSSPSFDHFRSRWLHYYNEMLIELGVKPIYETLERDRPRRLRIFISVFAGILFISFLFHLNFGYPIYLAETNFSTMVSRYLWVLPYSFVLALVCAMSAAKLKIFSWLGKFPQIAKVLVYTHIYFGIYLLAELFAHPRRELSLEELWVFVKDFFI